MIPNYQETFRIRTYADEVDPKTGKEYEYITYCSPECHDLIVEMKKQREADGETITGESPVFRTEYNPNPTRWGSNDHGKRVSEEERERRRIDNLKTPTALPHHGIQSYIDYRRQRYLGYKVMHGVKSGKARKDGPQLIHGFRYFHETTMGIKGVDKHVMEWLQGRELKTLAERYEEWPPEEILREYWKAVGDLTIDQTKYLQLTIVEKNQEIKNLQVDEQRRKENEWSLRYDANRAIEGNVRNDQTLEMVLNQLGAINLALGKILTPEQKQEMEKQLAEQMKNALPSSSLPLENKRIPIEKITDESDRESNDTDIPTTTKS